MQQPRKGAPVNPCMDVYKARIKSDGSLDKLKLRIVVRGDLQNKDMIIDTWYQTSSIIILESFQADYSKQNQGYTN